MHMPNKMVRCRYTFILAILLLLPLSINAESDDGDGDDAYTEHRYSSSEHQEVENDENEVNEDTDDEQEKSLQVMERRDLTMYHASNRPLTRTSIKLPLECYYCTYKAQKPLRACLSPIKFKVKLITCANTEEKCFTMVLLNKDKGYETVSRGCRSACVNSYNSTACCEHNRCNNQSFLIPPLVRTKSSSGGKSLTPSVLFYVTILLLLQTAGRVAFF